MMSVIPLADRRHGKANSGSELTFYSPRDAAVNTAGSYLEVT